MARLSHSYQTFCVLLILSGLGNGQQNGRFASLKSQAFTAFDRGQYAQVAGKLEEIWEQDHSDPKVAEYLAIGYLYGEHNVEKAKPLMNAALEAGGQATFLVQHSHEKAHIPLTGDHVANYCTGKMSIRPGKLIFTADSGEDSVTFDPEDLKQFQVLGGEPGRFQIKVDKKSYIFRVKSEKRDEVVVLQEFVVQNLKK
jgi:hypothetical protein